jgi:hypothetical protein
MVFVAIYNVKRGAQWLGCLRRDLLLGFGRRFIPIVSSNEQLEKSECLVEDALRLVSSVQVLQKAEKESIAGLLRDAHG